MQRGDAARTGVNPGPGPAYPPSVIWREPVNAVSAAPLYASGRVFVARRGVGDASAHIHAYDLKTGDNLWTAPVGVDLAAGPALDSGYVIAETNQDTLVAMKQASGEIVWTYSTGGVLGAVSPAITGGMVFLKVRDQSVRAVDVATGTETWRAPASETTVNQSTNDVKLLSTASVAVANGVVYAAGDGGILYALDARDGHQLWAVQTKGNLLQTPVAAGGLVFFAATLMNADQPKASNWLYALDAHDGIERWRLDIADSIGSMAIAGSALYVSGSNLSADRHGAAIVAFDVKTGRQKWAADVAGAGDLVLAGGTLYLSSTQADGHGQLVAINPTDGSITWRADAAAEPIQSLIVIDDVVVAATSDSIVAFGPAPTGGTPISAPEVDSANLPACNPKRQYSTVMPSETPSYELVSNQEQNASPQPQIPQILPADVPSGEQAPASDVAGINRTLVMMANCVERHSNAAQRQLAAFATDDFYRRPWVRSIWQSAGYAVNWPVTGTGTNPVTTAPDARLLPDGRVAVVFMSSKDLGPLVIFAEQDGQWLIDERYEITPVLGGHG